MRQCAEARFCLGALARQQRYLVPLKLDVVGSQRLRLERSVVTTERTGVPDGKIGWDFDKLRDYLRGRAIFKHSHEWRLSRTSLPPWVESDVARSFSDS